VFKDLGLKLSELEYHFVCAIIMKEFHAEVLGLKVGMRKVPDQSAQTCILDHGILA
jgi:hypothetical protein